MISTERFKKIAVSSIDDLRTWLETHHQQGESVWLVTYKKSVPGKYVSRWEVLDELICFGWIDGMRRKLDDRRTMQLISPRRAEHWARTYKVRAAKLIESGRMHASGVGAIERSKSAGLWNFMEEVDNLIVPDDLVQVLN
jgi:uncharacterized protein YdeI (YjbR/CyaY-like superfamily)